MLRTVPTLAHRTVPTLAVGTVLLKQLQGKMLAQEWHNYRLEDQKLPLSSQIFTKSN